MERGHDIDVQAADVDPVVRVHGHDPVFGYELLDERYDRFRQDDACRRRPLEDHAEQRKIEMVEVLVRDQDRRRHPRRQVREAAVR